MKKKFKNNMFNDINAGNLDLTLGDIWIDTQMAVKVSGFTNTTINRYLNKKILIGFIDPNFNKKSFRIQLSSLNSVLLSMKKINCSISVT